MLELEELITPSPAQKLVKGTWCTVGFCPAPGSGERLNIGVAFKKHRGPAEAKLISGAAGFRALFGGNGAENFSFLLAVTAEHIQRTGELADISPHISYGPRHPIEGTSSQDILEALFHNLITLRVAEEQAGGANNRALNTHQLRQSVIRAFRRKHSDAAARVLHEQPVVVNFENRAHLLDLPLWQSEDLASGRLFGSIVSTQYMHEVYRQHDLDRAFRNIDTARRFIASDGRGALFILRPPANDTAFPQQDIDNDIDAVCWPLAKIGIKIEVDDSIEQLHRSVAQFICG